MKKAQLEIIGIAIVVVLLVLGFLFVLKAISKPPISTQESFLKAHIAQDVLNTMSIADAQCSGMEMKELIKACAESTTVDCGEPCTVYTRYMKEILQLTLEEQKLPYRLRTYITKSPPKDKATAFSQNGPLGNTFLTYKGCNDTMIQRGYYTTKKGIGMFLIPTNAGDVKIMLEICSLRY